MELNAVLNISKSFSNNCDQKGCIYRLIANYDMVSVCEIDFHLVT